jgi:hypothetical protein
MFDGCMNGCAGRGLWAGGAHIVLRECLARTPGLDRSPLVQFLQYRTKPNRIWKGELGRQITKFAVLRGAACYHHPSPQSKRYSLIPSPHPSTKDLLAPHTTITELGNFTCTIAFRCMFVIPLVAVLQTLQHEAGPLLMHLRHRYGAILARDPALSTVPPSDLTTKTLAGPICFLLFAQTCLGYV